MDTTVLIIIVETSTALKTAETQAQQTRIGKDYQEMKIQRGLSLECGICQRFRVEIKFSLG